jgi:hypothetical protein
MLSSLGASRTSSMDLEISVDSLAIGGRRATQPREIESVSISDDVA